MIYLLNWCFIEEEGADGLEIGANPSIPSARTGKMAEIYESASIGWQRFAGTY